MFINGKHRSLGKNKPKYDKRTLKLSSFLKVKPVLNLPSVPEETSWITKLKAAESIPMYLNDKLGTCVAAAAGHMIQQWNFYAGHPAHPEDTDILRAYQDVGGYVVGHPGTDNGMTMLDFLNYWRKTGLGGHKILAFMAVDYMNSNEVQLAIQIFGNLFTGVQLPVSAQGEAAWTVMDGGIYSGDGQPGGWGGHCVNIVAGSPLTRTCETWGDTLKMSNRFFKDYVDEAYAVISTDWISSGNVSPSLFNLATLEAALARLDSIPWKLGRQ